MEAFYKDRYMLKWRIISLAKNPVCGIHKTRGAAHPGADKRGMLACVVSRLTVMHGMPAYPRDHEAGQKQIGQNQRQGNFLMRF